MRIGKIKNGAEYQIVEQFQNFQIFGILIVFKIEIFLKICEFSDLRNSKNFYNWLIWEIAELSKLLNFKILKNYRILKILQFGKSIFYSLKNYEIFWVFR